MPHCRAAGPHRNARSAMPQRFDPMLTWCQLRNNESGARLRLPLVSALFS